MQGLDDRMIFSGLEEASRAFEALGIPKGHLDAYIEAGEFQLAYDEAMTIVIEQKRSRGEKFGPILAQTEVFLKDLRLHFGDDYAGFYK